jgi:hypothetical protein
MWYTYCLRPDKNLVIKAPVIPIHGSIADIARAKRQQVAYARTKPVRNEAKKWTTSAAFSDMPC